MKELKEMKQLCFKCAIYRNENTEPIFYISVYFLHFCWWSSALVSVSGNEIVQNRFQYFSNNF